jgi:hypothetical protein
MPTSSRLLVAVAAALLAAALLATPLAAQTPPAVVVGVVRDSAFERPLVEARVEFPAMDAVAITDSAGRFRLAVPVRDDLLLVVRRLGYEPITTFVAVRADTVALDVDLAPVATALERVVVTAERYSAFARDLERRLRTSAMRTRLFGPDKMTPAFAPTLGDFILGRAALVRTPCGRKAAAWETVCVAHQGGVLRVLVAIDEAAPTSDFAQVRSRPLDDFAAVVVVDGVLVQAYTREYAARRERRTP